MGALLEHPRKMMEVAAEFIPLVKRARTGPTEQRRSGDAKSVSERQEPDKGRQGRPSFKKTDGLWIGFNQRGQVILSELPGEPCSPECTPKAFAQFPLDLCHHPLPPAHDWSALRVDSQRSLLNDLKCWQATYCVYLDPF